jgi:SAM-dependent methyltransferase
MDLIPGPPPSGFRHSMAATYDGVANQREEMGEAEWRWPIAERFWARMQAESALDLLELGAGVGVTSRWFADRGARVVATDLSPAQVELCLSKGLTAQVADMYALPFPDDSFDALWAMNCVHHVPNANFDEVLSEMARVLRKGAVAYIGVWGGHDAEGIPDDDFYQPPRFFAFRSDEVLRAALENRFSVDAFESFVPPGGDEEDRLHMQSVFLRSMA